MLHYLTRILTSKLLFKHPKKGYIYAVTGGAYLGELLVYIMAKDENKIYSFLTLPDMKVRDIPADKFKFGIREQIVDVVEKLPKYAYTVCEAQYTKNAV
jgi:hypothetical protein